MKNFNRTWPSAEKRAVWSLTETYSAPPSPGHNLRGLVVLSGAGHRLILYSARSWAELKMTKEWLHANRIPYDGIHLGKPISDVQIDDWAIAFNGWEEVLEKLDSYK